MLQQKQKNKILHTQNLNFDKREFVISLPVIVLAAITTKPFCGPALIISATFPHVPLILWCRGVIYYDYAL